MRGSGPFWAILATVALVVAGVPALMGAADASGSGTTSVTLFLRPADAGLLDRLARTGFTDRDARIRALERALPSDAAHRDVIADLAGQGFTPIRQTSWTVTLSAPTTRVSSVFGAVRGVLRLPARLRALVSSAVSGGGPRVVEPHALNGAELRRAYTSRGNTRHGIPPYTGHDRVQRLTIATIQFSGWNRNDLATYARANHLPYSASTLTQVPAGQSSVPTSSDGDGAVEVALDQEALLATAPHARQRAFFAPNTDAGFKEVFAQVLDDALGNEHAYRGGDRHIAALSVSWGMCETVGAGLNAEVNQTLKSLLAAGVTVFAASGDSGAYDCNDGLLGTASQGVDFPASSRFVVGVGGTNLTGTRGAPYNGANWQERAWSCTSKSDCAGSGLLIIGTGGSGGSGGGTSASDKPAYQSSLPGSGRAVPDIAAVADPATGFSVYSSHAGGTINVGGTSLAAPVSAALLTNTLAAHGARHGVGNIHPALYHAPRSAFRDITVGSNGAYDAGVGYDRVTGLGAPLWPALGNRFFRGKLPKAHASITRQHPHAKRKKWRRVTVHWGGHAPGRTKLLTAEVVVRRGNGRIVFRRSGARPHGSVTFLGRPGRVYKVSVQVANTRHKMSSISKAGLRVPRHR